MKTGKKLLALFLAVVMTMSVMTVGAFAEEPGNETAANGNTTAVEETGTQETGTPAAQPPVLTTDIGEKTFIVGQTTEFTFTTKNGNYTGGDVYGISNFSDTEGNEAAVKTLEFKQGNEWIDMKGQSFGGGEGFPLTDATSTFRVAFNKAGTYTFTAYMMPVGETGYANAVCSTEVTFEVKETPKVAQVGREQFETLQAAISAAEDDDTVKLLDNVTLTEVLTLDSGHRVTLDLGNHSITAGDHYIMITHGNLTVAGSGTVSSTNGNYTFKLVGAKEDVSDYSVLTIEKGVEVTSTGYGAMISPYVSSTDGVHYYGTKITINGTVDSTLGLYINGTLTKTSGNVPAITVGPDASVTGGLYAAGYAKYNVAGSIKGNEFGIEIRAGELTVEDTATITASGAFSDPAPNGNGSTVTGAAIAVSQHTTNLPIKVEIKGGNISETGTNGYALYEIDTVPDEADENVAKEVSISVTGGTFSGGVYSTNNKLSISGGKFSSTLDKRYLAEGYVQNANGEVGTLDNVAVAEITTADGTTKYETLQKAITAANDGDTIKLMKTCDVTSEGTITLNAAKKLTLDLSGKELTMSRFDLKLGWLTVQNGSVKSEGQAFNVYASGTVAEDLYTKLTIADNAVINAGWGVCLFPGSGNAGYSSAIEVYGKIQSGGIFVSGNLGNDDATAVMMKQSGKIPTIHIFEGALVSNGDEGQGIAMNGLANVVVDGGTVSGLEAIGVKRGALTVNGGTFTSNGAYKDPADANNNGTEDTGATISITSTYNYAGTISVALKSGTFTSKNGSAVYLGHSQKNGAASQYTKGVTLDIQGGMFRSPNNVATVYIADAISGDATYNKQVITGGYFTSDPSAYVADDHYVVDSDKTGYSYMVTDTAPVEAPVIVTETVDATVSDKAQMDETDKNTVTSLLTSNPPAVSGVADALTKSGENAILDETGVTEKEKQDTNNLIKIEIEAKVEAVQADLNKNELTFEVTPVATVTVNGKPKETKVPVNNNYLDGQGIAVKLPVPENFDVQEIKHTSDTKGVEYFLKTGTNNFAVKDGYVELTIRHFSELKMSGNVTAAAMVDGVAYPKLQDAINAAGNGDAITVLDGVDKTEKVTVSGKSLTIELGSTGYSADNITTGSRTEKVVTGTKVDITYSAPSGGGSSSSSGRYTVKVDSGKHGDVTVSPKRADKGDTVTITVDPDKGYVLDELTVTDKDGDTVKVKSKSDTKFTFTMPASNVTVEATFIVEKEEKLPFEDVDEDFWAVKEITWAYGKGYMNGVSADQFAPGRTVTRQQLWMVLARLAGEKPADMTAARQWAVENGVSDGSNPGGALTRQQMVTILYRYAKLMGYDVAGSADLTVFPDHASVADYAKEAMAWSVKNEIVGGTAQGTLNPAGTATRAQFAVILYRFCGNVL